jgi:hypothetical protein
MVAFLQDARDVPDGIEPGNRCRDGRYGRFDAGWVTCIAGEAQQPARRAKLQLVEPRGTVELTRGGDHGHLRVATQRLPRQS